MSRPVSQTGRLGTERGWGGVLQEGPADHQGSAVGFGEAGRRVGGAVEVDQEGRARPAAMSIVAVSRMSWLVAP